MNATELKLAELIREHPSLYDQSRRDYKDSIKGQLSWKEIAVAMEKSDEEVKLIWKNLRDKFSKAKKRLIKRNFLRLNDNGGQAESLVPGLFRQIAWLGAFVHPRIDRSVVEPEKTSVAEKKVAVRAEHLEKQQEKDKTVQPNFFPVINNSFSLADSSQSHQNTAAPLKRKRQTSTEMERSSADALSSLRDEDELFLLSLLPSIKRLTVKKRMEVRIKFQQVLYAAEFED